MPKASGSAEAIEARTTLPSDLAGGWLQAKRGLGTLVLRWSAGAAAAEEVAAARLRATAFPATTLIHEVSQMSEAWSCCAHLQPAVTTAVPQKSSLPPLADVAQRHLASARQRRCRLRRLEYTLSPDSLPLQPAVQAGGALKESRIYFR